MIWYELQSLQEWDRALWMRLEPTLSDIISMQELNDEITYKRFTMSWPEMGQQ